MKTILSFGGGVQTTALALLISEGKVKADVAIFADTGGEKPETYWYMREYTEPILRKAGVELVMVRSELPSEQPDLYGFLWKHSDIPGLRQRRCTDHFKLRPIKRYVGSREIEMMVGFSCDEAYRAQRPRHMWAKESYPLIDLGLTGNDCQRIIQEAGLPIPTKSSCFFCPFQPPFEWQWLKQYHPALFQKALDLEARWHERKPQFRDIFGLHRGLPLRWIAEGKQGVLGLTLENSCWSGMCGH